ncbi:MAG: ribonuclease III [Steroidobacteraceae bacterium]|jgi:ribonuclease-3|nr:ribonuclease III [Steroidobacteraceae bacterium]
MPVETSGAWLERVMGCRLPDPALLEEALTHRSFSSRNNERLEYLGDAVLSFLVAGMLYREFPDASEGELSRFRSSLVSGESLGAIALDLGLGDHLRLGEGELKSGGFRRASILADALEALVGALYLGAGLDAARTAVERLLRPRLSALPAAADLKDPKTRLQEFLQADGLSLPRYEVLEVSGEPHDQRFRVRCTADELGLSTEATGTSRRRAEQDAAERLLALAAPGRQP